MKFKILNERKRTDNNKYYGKIAGLSKETKKASDNLPFKVWGIGILNENQYNSMPLGYLEKLVGINEFWLDSSHFNEPHAYVVADYFPAPDSVHYIQPVLTIEYKEFNPLLNDLKGETIDALGFKWLCTSVSGNICTLVLPYTELYKDKTLFKQVEYSITNNPDYDFSRVKNILNIWLDNLLNKEETVYTDNSSQGQPQTSTAKIKPSMVFEKVTIPSEKDLCGGHYGAWGELHSESIADILYPLFPDNLGVWVSQGKTLKRGTPETLFKNPKKGYFWYDYKGIYGSSHIIPLLILNKEYMDSDMINGHSFDFGGINFIIVGSKYAIGTTTIDGDTEYKYSEITQTLKGWFRQAKKDWNSSHKS